jgi:hypothetical protein
MRIRRMEDAKQQAGEAADRAKSMWAQMKADAAARREDIKAKVNNRADQLDAKGAAKDAEWAEQDAADAIDRREPLAVQHECSGPMLDRLADIAEGCDDLRVETGDWETPDASRGRQIAMRQTTYGEDNRGAHLLSRSGRPLTIETTQVSIELSGPDLERLVSVADGLGFLRGRPQDRLRQPS